MFVVGRWSLAVRCRSSFWRCGSRLGVVALVVEHRETRRRSLRRCLQEMPLGSIESRLRDDGRMIVRGWRLMNELALADKEPKNA